MKAKTAKLLKDQAITHYNHGGMKYTELQTLAFELNEAVRKTAPKDR
jgi:hypothetical protein